MMSESYVKDVLCAKLYSFDAQTCKNTPYRKLVNFGGESRYTLMFDLFTTLQHCADYINSVTGDNIVLDSMPAQYKNEKAFKKWLSARGGGDETDSTSNKQIVVDQTSADDNKPASKKTRKVAIVAQNADKVLAMQRLFEALHRIQKEIGLYTDKKRYRSDPAVCALLFSLHNSAERLTTRIAKFKDEMKLK